MAQRRWIVEDVDRLPQTTSPITMTLSSQSDQKLGSLVGFSIPLYFQITMTLSGQSDQKAEVLSSEGEIFHGKLTLISVLLGLGSSVVVYVMI